MGSPGEKLYLFSVFRHDSCQSRQFYPNKLYISEIDTISFEHAKSLFFRNLKFGLEYLLTAQVPKVCRTPGPIACWKICIKMVVERKSMTGPWTFSHPIYPWTLTEAYQVVRMSSQFSWIYIHWNSEWLSTQSGTTWISGLFILNVWQHKCWTECSQYWSEGLTATCAAALGYMTLSSKLTVARLVYLLWIW